MEKKVVMVTGASSGIGYSTALLLASKGYKVYGAARRVDKMDPLREYGVVPMQLDVTDESSMASCVQGIISAEGQIDVLVNGAGYGQFGPIETVTMEEARKQLDVNLFGLAEMTRLVIPYMRSRRSGRIINISSMAGRFTIYLGAWYHASKYAVESFSDALRMEMSPFGIDVAIIEPGGIKTNWGDIAADNLRKSAEGTAYQADAEVSAKMLEEAYSLKLLTDPSKVAETVFKAVSSRRPRTRYVVGLGSRPLLFLHSILPNRQWDALMRKGTGFALKAIDMLFKKKAA